MTRDLILRSIEKLDYIDAARLTEEHSKLTVEFTVQGRTVRLNHKFPEELLHVPKFYLDNDHDFGKLAHVGIDVNGEVREVCVADSVSTAINTDRPELTYVDVVDRHVQLLTRLIEDPAFNRVEQLREFDAHWKLLCDKAKDESHELFVAWDGDKFEELQVKRPRTDSGVDLKKTPIALTSQFANNSRLKFVRTSASWDTRQIVGIALAVPLGDLEPAPASQQELVEWCFRILDLVNETVLREVQKLRKKKKREYWIVFSAPIPDGETMFAIRWSSNSNSGLPMSADDVEGGCWEVTPYRVRSLARKSLVPRGGGSMDLMNKSVLLVGCGSVGSDLALRLTSAGIGHLTVSDPDSFSEENLYRHTLSVKHIGLLKTQALELEIAWKHPWTEVTPSYKFLHELRDVSKLQSYDLVVIAIGSSNAERVFAEFCREKEVGVPVVYSWLEGYGIGGHAIIDIPGTKGCWHCAYVDPKTLKRGLTSNLNFLKPNQVFMKNQGGCGTQFLPYNGIAAGYTAAITADLSIRFFEGQVPLSSKISWKGSDFDAQKDSLEVSWRYRHFTESLHFLPLHCDYCDLCGLG